MGIQSFVAALAVAVASASGQSAAQIDAGGNIPAEALRALRYRLVGPFRGGRVNAVAGIAGDPTTYYFGTPGGGVWKTTDAGATWSPIFDEQPVSAVGALALAPSNPDVLYVGSGDPRIRGNVSHGNGVYKSVDAGATWTHVGLEDTRHIGQLVVHPTDPDTVLVAAVGHFYGENEARGVFKTVDGGASWKKVLYVDAKSGAVDVSFDPGDPRVLYATTWQILRTPWTFESGGPGSGLYRSTDAGETWTELEGRGLPESVLGKIGVAVSPADSRRVYALIEAEGDDGGLYRSDDGGASWTNVNDHNALTQRAWYFMRVVPDPVDRDVVYVMNIYFMKSEDGGASFERVDQFHVDNMDLWIDPENPKRMINGNDGGANISVNGGKTWSRSDDNQPIGQFYRVITDNQFPYHVYGGQQDWGTIAIASRGVGAGIVRTDWYPVAGCEMGWAAPDPRNADIVYAGCTDGGISRFDRRTGRSQSVEPWPETNIGHGAVDARYRFQWTAPIVISRHDPNVLYMTSNVVHRSLDEGMSWDVISPDLTRDDESKQQPAGGPITKDNVGTEVYGTIYALDESPVRPGLLWAGTDDGLIHLSRDAGETWHDVTPASLPAWSRVGMIDASPHAAPAAYVAIDRHELDDYRPYIYKTNDYGASWELVGGGIPDGTFVRVVREDAVRPGLLYAGTETGVYVSFDGGAHFTSLQLNLPVSPVWDLVVKEDDIVIATHGRAFWILDDVSALRTVTSEILSRPLHVFPPSPARRVREDFGGERLPHGQNPPSGAVIHYSLGSEPGRAVTITIVDAAGNEVDRLTSADAERDRFSKTSPVTTERGLNRFVWDLRYPGPELIPDHPLFMHPPPAPPVGALALPGSYTVRVEVDGASDAASATFEVSLDPRLTTPPEELRAQFELHERLVDSMSEITRTVVDVRRMRDAITRLEARARDAGADPVARASRSLVEELDAVESSLIEPRMRTGGDPSGVGGDAFHYPLKLDNKLSLLIGVVANSDRAPTEPSYAVYDSLLERIHTHYAALERLLARDVPALEQLAGDYSLPAELPRPSR